MTALIAEEAARQGFAELAKALETTLGAFLDSLSRDQQRQALRLSFELVMAEAACDPVAQPRLKLVYSRDL